MHRSVFVPGLIIAVLISFSGCGSAVTQLSEEDQNKVAAYCAQVVSKFNKVPATGLVRVAKQAEDTTDPSDEKNDTEESSASTSEKTAPAKTDDSSQDVSTSTLTDAIGISGMSFLYREAKTANGYQQGDVYDLTPDAGNELLVVRLKAKNTTKSSIKVDMPAEGIAFTATYGDESVDSDMTLLMNDLTTYQGTFKAGKSRNMLLLFQFPKGTVKDADKVQYSVRKGDTTVSINKDLSEKR